MKGVYVVALASNVTQVRGQAGVRSTVTVAQVRPPAKVKADLAKCGLYSPFLSRTIPKLQQLEERQYGAMLDLLARVGGFAKVRRRYTDPLLLVLPGKEDLQAIEFDRIVGNDDAMAVIIDRCLKFDREPRLDLTFLPRLLIKH